MFTDEQNIAKKFSQISSYLNEKTLRIWAAVEALSFPRGGITMVAKATVIARSTIHIGIADLQQTHDEKENNISTKQLSAEADRFCGGLKVPLPAKAFLNRL